MQTQFATISSVLNSRPLLPLTNDPMELNYLTPSHAKIGARVVQPLCSTLGGIPINRITQHKLLDKIQQEKDILTPQRTLATIVKIFHVISTSLRATNSFIIIHVSAFEINVKLPGFYIYSRIHFGFIQQSPEFLCSGKIEISEI